MLASLLLLACTVEDSRHGKHAMVIGHVHLATSEVAPGTDLSVRLKDVDLGGRVLGQSMIKGVSGSRIPFVIRYDPRQLVADHAYEVEAEVAGRSGNRLTTSRPIEVDPHDQRGIELALSAAPTGSAYAGAPADSVDEFAPSGAVVLPARAPAGAR